MPKYLVQTFGCQMNVHDSRRIEEVLEGQGFEPTEESALADLIVINTCSIREKAEHKLHSLLGQLRMLKEERRGLVLAVAGCVAQQEGEKLLKRTPELDIVIGPDNIPELPALVARVRGGGPPMARTVFDLDDPYFLVAKPRSHTREVTAFVTVMKGCDERCTYCIVPYTRGAERYRPADDIVREIAGMVAGGVSEVTLLGQTVNSWFEPGTTKALPSEASGSAFAALLRRIAAEVPDLKRLRYTSPHPRHVTPELVQAHAELSVLASHVHLPVQSGSNHVLRRMLRRYTAEKYIESALALRSARPGFTLSTDIIVGFPGETDAEFEETLDIVRKAGFVSAFGFKYSPRPYTPALKLGDDIPEEVKDARLARLFDVVAGQQQAHLDSLVGRDVQVLIEGPSRGDEGLWSGRSERNEIIHIAFPKGVDPTGQLLTAKVARANKHSLVGVVDPAVIATLAAVPAPVSTRRLPVLSDTSLS